MSANGYLTDAELVAVQGTIQLANVTAAAWLRMEAACLTATGVNLTITSPYGGYRSLAMQQYMWTHRDTSTSGQVAYPGTSVHGDGSCVDISNWGQTTAVAAWLRAHAGDFGFRRTIPTEPWHFQHDRSSGGGGGAAPSTPTEKDTPIMALPFIAVYDQPGTPGHGSLRLVTANGVRDIGATEWEVNAARAIVAAAVHPNSPAGDLHLSGQAWPLLEKYFPTR